MTDLTSETTKPRSKWRYIAIGVGTLLAAFLIWQSTKTPQTEGNWQEHLAVLATAEFNGDEVAVKNVRNFRYAPTEADEHANYYDKTYRLDQIKKVWYVTEPFNEDPIAAHTFLSFEFENGDFLAITIEARKTEGQIYSPWKGMLRTYPLIYIPADERDVVMLRANVRKDNVYVYPVKLSEPENGRALLTDLLTTMNDLAVHPKWYNTLWANCTSRIAYHVNKLTPGRISRFSPELVLTSSADELALKLGLLDTDLSIEEARKKYLINEVSQAIGDVPNYSQAIRGQAKDSRGDTLKTYKNEKMGIQVAYSTNYFGDPEYLDDSDYNVQHIYFPGKLSSRRLQVRIVSEPVDGIYCHEDLCEKPAGDQVKLNGTTWDYLGMTRYCDVGQCSPYEETYRTTHNGNRYYVLVTEKPLAQEMLDTFEFTR